jgi:putative ABC transport system permease protein
MRNPRRTSATSSALMIGVALVACITVFAASAKASVATSIDKAMKTDWVVTTQFGMGGLPPSVTQQLASLPQTRDVTPLRYFDTKVGTATTEATAVDPARVEEGVKLAVRNGSIAKLGAHGVAVQADEAKKKGLHLGDTLMMFFPETGTQRCTVVATYGTKDPIGNYAISIQALDANSAVHVDNDIVVSAAPGISKA